MLALSRFLACVLILVCAAAVPRVGRAQDAEQATTPEGALGTAATAWTCPVHREIHAEHPGPCPICERDLVETRLDQSWTCPIHPVIAEPEGGSCPICQRTLIPITVEVGWVCPMHPEVHELHEGTCPICRMDLVRQDQARPHEDHNPKHGGIFFMAPDSWHHLEGTYPEPGIFRVHFYDNYSQPLSAGELTGRAVLKEVYDADTQKTYEAVARPLRLVEADGGTTMEARVGNLRLPAEVTAKIRFEPDGSEERFDFIFAELSVEPVEGAPTETAEAELFARKAIPDTPDDIAFEIATRDLKIQQLIRKGQFGDVWIPALEAKDLALALDSHLARLPRMDQYTLRLAMKQFVRSAWMLDWYGDLGNKQQVADAYALFGSAVGDIKLVYDLP